MVPGGLITLAEAAAVAHGRTRIIAVVTSTENIVRTVVPLILILNGYGLPAICASFLAVRCLALAAYIPQSRGLVSRKWIRSGELRGIVRIAPTFAGTVIAASIMWQGPAVLLGRFSNELETAQYGAASRFMIPASILMASYADVIQPHLVHYAQRSRAMLGQYLRRIGSIPFVLAVIAAIASPFAAGLVLSTLFGSRYAEAASTLEIFAVCLIPYTLIMLMARGLISMRAQKIDLLANMIGALVLVAAGWILVPEYGAVGAAASQLLGFVLMAVIEVAAVTYLVNRPGSSRGTERSVETDSGWKMTGIPSLQSRPSDN
jgi:O-antigen/teichoic acid export membrane protein